MLRLILGTTTQGKEIAIESIYVEPTKSATIKYKLISIGEGISSYEYVLDGEQYSKWGTDDTILYHIICNRHRLQYKPYEEPEFFEETIVWRDEKDGELKCDLVKKPNPNYTGKPIQIEAVPIPEGLARFQEDNRSVHNDADIQRITSLETELEEQRKKLQTIMSLLGKNTI